ncbi:MAG: ATP-binding protein [Phycisphaerae bacterium]|nr:ATP-binding protein [Saprospiraceae bacterium]
MHRYVSIQSDGKVIAQKKYGFDPKKSVKKYEFKLQNGRKGDYSFLTPPHGGNFYNILRSHLELREEIQEFLKPNGLELLLDEENKRVSILQREAASVLSFPLHLVPDTFQRYIFHLAAIMSNLGSVLLFEEPESHSYPPYVYQLAQYILEDEGGNQFFITTHNPYFLLPIMQEGKDVAVFVTWFKDYQTHARRLTEEELSEVLNYGVDLFLNLDHFIPE